MAGDSVAAEAEVSSGCLRPPYGSPSRGTEASTRPNQTNTSAGRPTCHDNEHPLTGEARGPGCLGQGKRVVSRVGST